MAQTTTVTLVEFLTARLDEDEAAARACEKLVPSPDGLLPVWLLLRVQDISPSVSGHLARHDPARVLREVAAKRAIVAEHQESIDYDAGDNRVSDGCAICEGYYPCPTVRHLASVYAGHPDYREEWRP